MLKNISNLGKALSKAEQQAINGGLMTTFNCYCNGHYTGTASSAIGCASLCAACTTCDEDSRHSDEDVRPANADVRPAAMDREH
jgi:hypothetical protein